MGGEIHPGVAIVALITFRDGLRARLREAGPSGIPPAVQGTVMIAAHLTAELAEAVLTLERQRSKPSVI